MDRCVSTECGSERNTWWTCTRWGRRGTWAPRHPLRSYTPRSLASQTERRMAWRQTWPVDPDSVSETKGRRGKKKKERERKRGRETHSQTCSDWGIITFGMIQGPGRITWKNYTEEFLLNWGSAARFHMSLLCMQVCITAGTRFINWLFQQDQELVLWTNPELKNSVCTSQMPPKSEEQIDIVFGNACKC